MVNLIAKVIRIWIFISRLLLLGLELLLGHVVNGEVNIPSCLELTEKVGTGGVELPMAARPWSIFSYLENSYHFFFA